MADERNTKDNGTSQEPERDFRLTEPDANIVASSPVTPWRGLTSDLPSALLAITLLMMPLYRTRILEDSFNTPKLALALALGVLTAIGLLARSGSFRMKLQWYPVPWLLVGLAVWQAISVLWADSKPLGVDGAVYFAAFAVMGWLFYRGPMSRATLRGLFHAGAVGATITAAWALVDDFTGGAGPLVARLPDWRGHLAAGLGNSGHIAGMVGMFLPWILICFLWKPNDESKRARPNSIFRWLLLIPIALMFASLIVTWSVGSSGATIISMIIWGIVAGLYFRNGRAAPPNHNRPQFCWRRAIGVIAVGLGVMTFYFTPVPLNPHKPSILTQAFGSSRWEAGWPTRVVIWETTWQMIRQDPLVGIGAGNFTYGYTQQVVPSVLNDPALAPYSGAFTNDAHNDYLQLWAEGGVIALALWLAALAAFFVTITRTLRRTIKPDEAIILIGAGAGMTVFALDGLMSFPMQLPAHFTMAMFFLAAPGVILRLQARDNLPKDSHGNTILDSALRRKIYQRRLRTGGIGIVLTLAACVWHHGHRVVAEYYLKTGRDMAGSAIVTTGDGQAVPVWAACDSIYQQTLRAIAAGAPETAWRPALDQMKKLSAGATMDDASSYFKKSLAADRWYANASSRLGQLLLFRGDYKRSVKVSKRTLKTLEAYEIHERLGAAAFFSGDMKNAREHWSICLTRRPENAALYEGLLKRIPL